MPLPAAVILLSLLTSLASGALKVDLNGAHGDLSKLKNGQAIYKVNN
jgi:hypothetical protein